MKHPKAWWQSWPVAVIGLIVLGAGIVPTLLPEKKPKVIPQETEVYLQPVEGHMTASAPAAHPATTP